MDVTCSSASASKGFMHRTHQSRVGKYIASNCPPLPVLYRYMHIAVMADTRVANLLDLDDHLLYEVFKSLSVRDKQQNVQLACLRFRAVLQRPSSAETWGCITVKSRPYTQASPESILRLITWLLNRKSGESHTLAVGCISC